MGDYYLTRFIFQRALALIYLIGFLIIINQFKPLLGEKGLLPVPQFIKYIPFFNSPSIFYLFPKDKAFMIFGVIGFLLSIFALSSFSERFGLGISMVTWFFLWAIYLSFVNVGQVFYSFGWESMLLEAGFLSIFLGDMQTKVPITIIFLLRFILFKDMFGSGLIKLRGDECWRDLTCLKFHYETQPIPNPLSWFFHWLPLWNHKSDVVFNHVIEIIAPFTYFFSQLYSFIGGGLTMFFQGLLMISGNFSFLNLLTIVLCIPTFSDTYLSKIIALKIPPNLNDPYIYSQTVLVTVIILGIMNIRPIINMISPNQIMNTSYDPLHLVGSYGAFGTVTKERYEIIIEGTDSNIISQNSVWKEYDFFGKPGKVDVAPIQIAPYHLRLDWLMWFAAFSKTANDPWFVHLMQKLLLGDKDLLSLFKSNPFPNSAPKYIRALYYKYNFTTPEEKSKNNNWWKRDLIGEYFPAVSLNDARFKSILNNFGW